jgi:hypothetical protein
MEQEWISSISPSLEFQLCHESDHTCLEKSHFLNLSGAEGRQRRYWLSESGFFVASRKGSFTPIFSSGASWFKIAARVAFEGGVVGVLNDLSLASSGINTSSRVLFPKAGQR